MDSIPDPDHENDDGRFHTVLPTAVGPLRIVARGTAVVGVYHEDHQPPPTVPLLGRLADLPHPPEGDRPAGAGGPAVLEAPPPAAAVLAAACQELTEYFDGFRQGFGVPTEPRGTPFQLRVWAVLEGIPYGERRSYRDVATDLGNPGMGRAVGAAVRANPLSIIIPGHRVVSSSGSVLGYAAGIDTKIALLELEQKPVGPISR